MAPGHRKSQREMPEDNHPDWDKALKDEDCVEVKRLLKVNKDLLSKGWNLEDKSLKGEARGEGTDILLRKLLEKLLSEGSEENVEASQKLKGRTALHVAARRGDLKLLEFIVRDILHVGGKCLGQFTCRVLEVIDSDYELDALAMAVATGNREIINLLMKTSRDCEFNPYDVSPDRDNSCGSAPSDGDALSKADADKMEGILKGITEEACPSLSEVKTLYAKYAKGLASSEGDAISNADADEMDGITKALKESPSPSVVKDLYADCDFNFNSLEISSLYLFHFTFSTWTSNTRRGDAIERVREEIFSRALRHESKEMLLKYLFLDLKDGQGRTPLHVAVDSSKVQEFLELLRSGGTARSNLNEKEKSNPVQAGGTAEGNLNDKLIKSILNGKDGAGRTPLYRAAAKNQRAVVEQLLADGRVNINEKITYNADQWGKCLDLDKLSWKNGFKSDCVYITQEKLLTKAFNNKDNAQGGPGPTIDCLEKVSSTALHVAIILKHEDIVEKIVHKLKDTKDDEDVECHRQFTLPLAAWKKSSTSGYTLYEVSTMKLAVLVGSIGIMQTLLEAEDRKPGLFTTKVDEDDYPTFHLAAAVGTPGIVKAFLDSKNGNFNATVVDCFSNTALHHALKGKYVTVHPHLVDFVGCHHVFRWRWNNDDWISEWLAKSRDITEMRSIMESNENAKVEDRYGQRMGSINLLLEAGINIWEKNETKRTASPEPDAPEEFVKWWYEKVATETQEDRTKLNDAANAIAVTATLVATASYVGPFQPPLGYGEDSLQANILAVRIFVVCDSLSFYLALGAIMLSLLPALPLPEQSMFREQVRKRICVVIAVAFFLFPSIVCVLLAFATAYIAASPEDGLGHHGLTIGTTVAGGVACLLVIIAFILRLGTIFTTLPKEVKREVFKSIALKKLKGF